jgi:glycosyltransferase involved in cell wall biosynthesis
LNAIPEKRSMVTVGIDASNLRGGGGVTHLAELLRALQPDKSGVCRVVVWGGTSTLQALDDGPWLAKRSPAALDKSLLQRTLWQSRHLSAAAREEKCHVLFVPGGSFAGDFHCVVTMSQNLLPFETRELLRYGLSRFTLKWLLLRFTQARSFRKSAGVVFLTQYAKDAVLKITGPLEGETPVIPHGLNPRFEHPPKLQRPVTEYDGLAPYRILYVSVIDYYKHQGEVVEAVAALREQGLPVFLDLVGPAFPPALLQLNTIMDRFDPKHEWVCYHGPVQYAELHEFYIQADMGIWASTCETFGIILLEAMASGLPIACSNKQPMPDVTGGAAVYFDAENPADIARSLRELIDSPSLRATLAQAGFEHAKGFSWQRCADETFEFLARVSRKESENNKV